MVSSNEDYQVVRGGGGSALSWFTPGSAAKVLKVSRQRVAILMASGILQVQVYAGSKYVSSRSVYAYMASRQNRKLEL